MRIGVIGSMQFTEEMFETCEKLKELGHDAYLTSLHKDLLGKSDEEKERIKIYQKNNLDAIREFWYAMQGGDAVLALNKTKNNIENYIGANTFLEIGFAYVLNQGIYLFNPMPKDKYIITELEAIRPIIINQDLTKIPLTI